VLGSLPKKREPRLRRGGVLSPTTIGLEVVNGSQRGR
jgi:hypothetical protein